MQTSNRKGIILAGGLGTRLYPSTLAISKQLLPIYDKPMIYYPICVLMLAGIRDIVIITTPQDLINFQKLLGNGNKWGVNFSYVTQPKPKGLAQAFIIAENFIRNHPCALILGDNIFFGRDLGRNLTLTSQQTNGAAIFIYRVQNPQDYGVIEFNQQGKVVSIQEKPITPPSNYAVTGIYFYDTQVIDIAKSLTPSARGELEITDINQYYLNNKLLQVNKLNRGTTWLDCGTKDALMSAGQFIQAIEKRQGLKIACPEEIAYRLGFIDFTQLEKLAYSMTKNSYTTYLQNIFKEETQNTGEFIG